MAEAITMRQEPSQSSPMKFCAIGWTPSQLAGEGLSWLGVARRIEALRDPASQKCREGNWRAAKHWAMSQPAVLESLA
nr:hypothetical protein [Methylobacterium sp. ZNC0032]